MECISCTNGIHDDDRLALHLQPVNRRSSMTDELEEQAPQRYLSPSDEAPPQPSSKQRARSIGQAAKAKAKKVLRFSFSKDLKNSEKRVDTEEEEEYEGPDEDDILKDVKRNPAFSPKQLIRKEGFSVSGTIDATFGTTKGTLNTIAHPRRALKAKAAKKLATPEHPYLSPEADLQLLDVHDEMVKMQSSRTASSNETSSVYESERERLEEKINDLESDREKARVAWITSRHIFRVRVVPKQHFNFPTTLEYYERHEDGTCGKFRYERYIGAIMLYYCQDFTSQYIDDFNTLPFSRETLIRHMERLVMVSAPWQEWLVNVRRVYRWEDPKKTGKWLAIILCMWYYNHMVTFFWSYLLFITVRRRVRPESVEEIRTSYERALSRGTQAFKLSELIGKHGNDKWLDPFLDEIGPIVQLQIGDLADLLEMYQNCYDWKDPVMTTCTLMFIVACILLGHFTTMEFSVKTLEWVGILYFFFSRPISSLYPRYRHLVSPIKWIIWEIPTHAEWAFRYLRSEAQNARAAIIEHRVTEKYLAEEIHPAAPAYGGDLELPNITRTISGEEKAAMEYDSDDSATSYRTTTSSASAIGSQELLSFRCRWRSYIGRLILSGSGLKFVSALPSRSEQWSRSYLELVEMRKRSSESRVGRAATIEVLQFHWIDGTTDEVLGTRGCRDEMFNCVLGFSGLKWQALQPLGGDLKTKQKREKENAGTES